MLINKSVSVNRKLLLVESALQNLAVPLVMLYVFALLLSDSVYQGLVFGIVVLVVLLGILYCIHRYKYNQEHTQWLSNDSYDKLIVQPFQWLTQRAEQADESDFNQLAMDALVTVTTIYTRLHDAGLKDQAEHFEIVKGQLYRGEIKNLANLQLQLIHLGILLGGNIFSNIVQINSLSRAYNT